MNERRVGISETCLASLRDEGQQIERDEMMMMVIMQMLLEGWPLPLTSIKGLAFLSKKNSA